VKDVVIIAVKPNFVVDVCKDIVAVKDSDALVISVAAGVTLHTLEKNLPGRRVVRVMPNTACVVGQSASGFTMGTLTKPRDRAIVDAIFASVGVAIELKGKEELLNAVTGLSGSGPAYVFEFIEALADGGVRVGLPRKDALELAAQTVKGAAEMVLQMGTHPGELKDRGTFVLARPSELYKKRLGSHLYFESTRKTQFVLLEEPQLLELMNWRKGECERITVCAEPRTFYILTNYHTHL
jgi:pyrroline-5-carboxylate reductase